MPELTLNLFPAILTPRTITVWSGLYPGPDAVAELEASDSGIATWRDIDDASHMYVWHRTDPEYVPQGLVPVTVRLEEAPHLFQRMIQGAVAVRFRELGFEEKSDGWVNYAKGGLMAKVPSLVNAVTEPIDIFPKIITEVFFTRTPDEAVFIGLVVDILYTTRMDVTAAEWDRAGLQDALRGTYVRLVPGSGTAKRFQEYEGRNIGRVHAIQNGTAILRDLRDGRLASAPLGDIAPEPSRANLATYLNARYERAYASGEKELTRNLRELVRPYSRYKLANGLVLDRLQAPDSPYADDGLCISPGVYARFSPMARTSAEQFPARKLKGPEYSFDQAGAKYGVKVDAGIQRFGPYDQERMRNRALRVLVVAPADNQGDVKLAMQKLLNGVDTRKNVFPGLKKMYRLESIELIPEIATSASMKDYGEAVHRAIREAPAPPSGEPRFHMVLTVIREAHERLPDSENPYFQTKAIALTTEGIPTQAITIEKLRARDDNLQYILNTMAVACYAKLGGTSHVLKLPVGDGQGPTELVFGVGRSAGSTRESGRFGERQETVGFATVFRANGEYLYNDATPYCDDASYERSLEDTIRRTVERVASFEQLPHGAPLNLIFHVPRRPGQREEKAILNAVGKLPRFDLKFALVHVNDEHHLQLFDLNNSRPRTYLGAEKPEARFLPPRGIAVTLGPRERLVTFIGVDQYRGNGSPAPLRITLHKKSTFNDIDYLTQQLYWLSFMSVRSLNPGIAPVTVSYAERLAYITGHLRGVQQWTVELIQQKLGRKLWFV